jgi:hypothetical protein
MTFKVFTLDFGEFIKVCTTSQSIESYVARFKSPIPFKVGGELECSSAEEASNIRDLVLRSCPTYRSLVMPAIGTIKSAASLESFQAEFIGLERHRDRLLLVNKGSVWSVLKSNYTNEYLEYMGLQVVQELRDEKLLRYNKFSGQGFITDFFISADEVSLTEFSEIDEEIPF